MPGRFPYKSLVKYPHLKPEDVATWNAFIEQFPDHYTSVDYDTPVGELQELAAEAQRLEIAGSEQVNRYKIDCVGYREGGIDIIELKGKATPSAIGQVLSYRTLYLKQIKSTVPVRAVIITRETAPEMDALCEEHGVNLILV